MCSPKTGYISCLYKEMNIWVVLPLKLKVLHMGGHKILYLCKWRLIQE